jgi:hypothetical protein
MDSLDGSEDWNDASYIWLTFPQNFIYVISREIEQYWEFKARKDAFEATIYTKVDAIIENTDAMVTAYNIRVAGAS